MGQDDGSPGRGRCLCSITSGQGQDRATLPLAARSHRAHLPLEKIDNLNDARQVLSEERDRYCHHQVHSTTKEIPAVRFGRAHTEENSLFRPFSLPAPYTSPDDVFCLQETRVTNGYGRISLFNHDIRVANVPLREQVDVHMIPDFDRDIMRVRIWHRDALAHTVEPPLQEFAVHF